MPYIAKFVVILASSTEYRCQVCPHSLSDSSLYKRAVITIKKLSCRRKTARAMLRVIEYLAKSLKENGIDHSKTLAWFPIRIP